MSEFRAGQVWTYKTRPGEEASRLVVCRVDPNEEFGPIIHVHVEGVALKNPLATDGCSRVIRHMPLAEASLRASVVKLEDTRQLLPDYEEGYDEWRDAFDDGNAGFFTISVSDAVDFVEQTLNR